MTLGIDIGGTTIGLGLVQDGKIIKKVSVPSFPAGATMEQTLDYLASQIAAILPAEATKIGIGVPSVVDVEKGIVYEATNIPSWQEVHIKENLEARFPVTVSVNNDANCFAMGAYAAYPKEQKPEVLVGITLGTGVGIGIIDRGRLFGGANCGAGELGCLPFRSGIQLVNLFDQLSVFLRRDIFRFEKCVNDIVDQKAACNLSAEPDDIRIEFLSGVKSCRHVAHKRCPDAGNFVYGIVDADACSTDADAEICFAMGNRLTDTLSVDRIMRAEIVICAAVNHFMTFLLEMVSDGNLFDCDNMVTSQCDPHSVSSSMISFPI